MREIGKCLECGCEVEVTGSWFSPCCGSRYVVLSSGCVYILEEWNYKCVALRCNAEATHFVRTPGGDWTRCGKHLPFGGGHDGHEIVPIGSVLIEDEWDNGLVSICGWCDTEVWTGPSELRVSDDKIRIRRDCGCHIQNASVDGSVFLSREFFWTDGEGREYPE